MKVVKLGILLLGLCVVCSTMLLAEPASMTGILMPVVCKDRKSGSGADHTTECALKPDCIESGFGLWTKDSFTPFDTQGNDLALKYFKMTHREDNHRVLVTGNLEGSILQVMELVPLED